MGGTEPLSATPRMVGRVEEWARGDGLWMAGIDGEPAGALVVGVRPDHVHAVDVDELYARAGLLDGGVAFPACER